MELSSPRRGFAKRNAQRLLSSVRVFRAAQEEFGTTYAMSESIAELRIHVYERLLWLLDRLSLRGGKVEKLVRAAWPEPVMRGVLFVGYVEAGLGLGESLRGLILALSTTTIRLAIWPFKLGVESRRIGPFMPDRYDLNRTYRVNVIEIAPDQVPHLINVFGSERLERSYNVLRTYWELPHAPIAWIPNLALIDEIWAPTTFVAEALGPIFDGPIVLVPPCVGVKQEEERVGQKQFALEETRFYYLFSFDFHSRVERKNPLATLRAFQMAFPDGREQVGLVIKTTGLFGKNHGAKDTLRRSADSDPRIVLIDDMLSREEMLSLINLCSCYVSLHRSEGFGLGMAEAMAFGKPVIGTDFSGSKDFLNAHTGFPIPYRLQPLLPGDYPFAEGQSWAEPNIQAASDAMRLVFTNRVLSNAKGAAAKAFVTAHYGRATVAGIAEARLRSILKAKSRGRRTSASG